MRRRNAFIAALAIGLGLISYDVQGGSLRRGGGTFTLTGTLRVAGNEPFTYVVLRAPSPEGGGGPVDYHVQGPLAEKLREYQGKTAILECRRCAENRPDRPPCVEPTKILGVE